MLHAVASEVLPRRWRGWSQGFLMCFSCVGAFVALVVGGLFSRSGGPDGFRSYFYIGAALYFVAGALLLFVYRPSPRDLQTLPLREKMAKLDWVGYGLLIGGLVSFCVGLSYSQNPYPWSSPTVYAPFAVGLVLLVCLGLYEWQVKPDGIVHHGLFQKSRNFPLTLICLFCEGLAFMGANAYLASEVRLGMGRDVRTRPSKQQLTSFQISTLFAADPVMTGINYGSKSLRHALILSVSMSLKPSLTSAILQQCSCLALCRCILGRRRGNMHHDEKSSSESDCTHTASTLMNRNQLT